MEKLYIKESIIVTNLEKSLILFLNRTGIKLIKNKFLPGFQRKRFLKANNNQPDKL